MIALGEGVNALFEPSPQLRACNVQRCATRMVASPIFIRRADHGERGGGTLASQWWRGSISPLAGPSGAFPPILIQPLACWQKLFVLDDRPRGPRRSYRGLDVQAIWIKPQACWQTLLGLDSRRRGPDLVPPGATQGKHTINKLFGKGTDITTIVTLRRRGSGEPETASDQ